jgi:hypothetical protein
MSRESTWIYACVDFICGRQACGNMCTNVSSAGTGVVQSPNFPGDYGSKSRICKVSIVVPAGKNIQLTFTTFNLETGKGVIKVSKVSIHIDGISSFQCKAHLYCTWCFYWDLSFYFRHIRWNDRITFCLTFQGYDKITIYLDSVTGSTIPDVVTTTSNVMLLQFITSRSTKPNTAIYNWQATYTAV